MQIETAKIQIITAQGWDGAKGALIEPDVRHSGRFIVFCEAAGPWPDDTFSFEAVSLESGTKRQLSLLGVLASSVYDFVVFALKLPSGQWELRVHSAWAKSIVASRKVAVI